ncbi:MAG: protein kinase, partial [Planctomycetaceae bacterium]|nr:protein kinase [Planctomycetaceae bacterium]
MSNDASRRSGSDNRDTFQTQLPTFLRDSASDPSGGTADRPLTDSESAGGGSGHDTYFAPPISLRAVADLPPKREDDVASKTHRADSEQLRSVMGTFRQSRLTERGNDGDTKQPDDRRPMTASDMTMVSDLPEHVAARGGRRAAPGRSTWNLRIRQRAVAGHISGIENRIPEPGEETAGLLSAFATDDSTAEYEIVRELGSGNMGVVYLARQTSLNRDLAVKTLKPDSPNAEQSQAMFVSEAVVTANLVHPNIVPIHDLGRTADGKLFYSMKQVRGTAWNASLCDKSPEENLDILLKVCDAVAYAHSRGVINRDLKPENVIVGSFGEVIVLDWGLAMTTSDFARRDSVVVDFHGPAGTPVYMAPELADEQIDGVGPHSDIYLLGAILYEVLEGFPPHLLRKTWEEEDPSKQLQIVINAVINNEIESRVRHRGELMQIALKAMSTRPEDRFSTVEEFQEAIREYRITGRAEELMQQVELKRTTSYHDYQTAVALYEEALRKWPNNRRAVNGDRRARQLYAELALQKGDVDLGLQIIPDDTDRRFADVRRKLKSTKRNRSIIRGTWTVTSLAAVIGAFIAAAMYFEADKARAEADTALADLETAHGNLEQQTARANEKTKEADAAQARADEAAKIAAEQAVIATRMTTEAKTQTALADRKAKEALRAEKLAEDAEKQTAAARQQTAMAVAQQEQAEKEVRVYQQQVVAAKTEIAAAEKKVASANDAVAAAEKKVFSAFLERLNALEEIANYKGLSDLIDEELGRENPNPLIRRAEGNLRDRQKAALLRMDNASLELPQRADAAFVSTDGTAMVVKSNDTLVPMTDLRPENPPSPDNAVLIRLPESRITSVAVSRNATSVCAWGRRSASAWIRNSKTNSYTEVQLEGAQA